MAYTTIDDPGLYFNTLIWTGDDFESRDITGVGFQPDWVWGKRRDDAAGHNLLDSVRGAGQDSEIQSNTTGAEGDGGQNRFGFLSAFLSDGFRVEDGSEASGDKAYWNQNSATYVAWNWKAGGSASSNTDGSITSSVSANQTAGFSIVSYTGTGSALTCGHGLGAVPQWIIVKDRDAAANWNTYHIANGNAKTSQLNLGNAPSATSSWNSTTPTSSVFSLGAVSAVNTSSNDYIAYCFAEKQGYSKIGSYTGNNSSDGTFLYLGFKPAFIILKDITVTDPWILLDNKRSSFNVVNHRLFPQNSNSENTSDNVCDFVANGIKFRSSNDGQNGSRNYLYYAVAESSFVNSKGVPNNAR
jgi:hypothetical protein